MNLKKLNETLELSKEFILGSEGITFNQVAFALYEVHMEMSPVYKKYANKSLDTINVYEDIPLVPMKEFNEQMVELDLHTDMPYPGVVFKHGRLRHYIRDTEHYRAAIYRGLKDNVLEGQPPAPQYNVIDFNHDSRHDNVSYFTQYVGELLDHTGSARNMWPIDPDRIIEILRQDGDVPVILIGFAHHFKEVYKELQDADIQLHQASKVIQVSKETIEPSYIGLGPTLGIPMNSVVRMYNHPLMSTQLYAVKRINDMLRMPHSARVELKKTKSSKRMGFIDVANVWSCPFVNTSDEIDIHVDGFLVR